MKKLKEGQHLSILFMDHCSGSGSTLQPVLCEAYGKLKVIGTDHLELITWDIRSEEPGVRYGNQEGYCILKSTILFIDLLIKDKCLYKNKK